MTRPRKQLIDRDEGGFYHIVSRCVRRAWLSGRDPVTNRDFSHRRGWIEARLLALSDVFTVDVYGYAVMSNHYHIVLRYRPQEGKRLSDEEVARRWLTVFPPKPGADLDALVRELGGDPERTATLRGRLSDLSWYMQCLNAPVARRANLEDGCTGRFWEGRFHSKALPDERAVQACMAYADLNPLRAGEVDRIDAPSHTALRRRLDEAEDRPEALSEPVAPLGFDASRDRVETVRRSALKLTLSHYRAHVEWAAARGAGGPCALDREQRAPPTLSDPESWLAIFNKLRRRTVAPVALRRGMMAFGTCSS